MYISGNSPAVGPKTLANRLIARQCMIKGGRRPLPSEKSGFVSGSQLMTVRPLVGHNSQGN